MTNVDKSKFYTFNNNIYFGMVKNGKCEGKGIMLYEEGYLYEGEWKNGLRNGYGRMIDRNG